MKAVSVFAAMVGVAALLLFLDAQGNTYNGSRAGAIAKAAPTVDAGQSDPGSSTISESLGYPASVPLESSRADRERLEAATRGQGEALRAASSEDPSVAEATLGVTFKIPVSSQAGWVFFQESGATTFRSLPILEGDSQALAELVAGHWTALFKDENGAAGVGVTFEVVAEDQMVELSLPGTFNLTVDAVNRRTGIPMSGVAVELVRTDLPTVLREGAEVELHRRAATSNAAGLIELPNLQVGMYVFSASYPGFAPKEFSIPLPGDFSDEAQATGRAHIGELKMVELTPFSVQLAGIQDWGGAGGFFVAHTHDGEKVPFDATGLATLSLAWFSEPLYLKLWFPDGKQEAVAYLDGGMPPPGKPWVVDVSTDADLSVDLRIADEILERIDQDSATLVVTTTTERGDAFTQGLEADRTGIFTIKGVTGNRAMVEYIAPLDGNKVSLGVEAVTLQRGGDASCILTVDSLPTRLSFADASGEPFAGGFLALRERGGGTGWAFGAPLDAKGQVVMTIPIHLDLSMRFTSEDHAIVAVDRSISWESGLPEMSISLVGGGVSTVRAMKGSRAAAGIVFELFGAHSTQTFDVLTSDEHGLTEPVSLVSGSNPRLRLRSADLWMPHAFIVPEPGTQSVEVYDTGHITLEPTVSHHSVQHVEEGSSLAAWIKEGLVTTEGGGAGSLRVPCGTYRVIQDGEIVWEAVLQPGATLRVEPAPR